MKNFEEIYPVFCNDVLAQLPSNEGRKKITFGFFLDESRGLCWNFSKFLRYIDETEYHTVTQANLFKEESGERVYPFNDLSNWDRDLERFTSDETDYGRERRLGIVYSNEKRLDHLRKHALRIEP